MSDGSSKQSTNESVSAQDVVQRMQKVLSERIDLAREKLSANAEAVSQIKAYKANIAALETELADVRRSSIEVETRARKLQEHVLTLEKSLETQAQQNQKNAIDKDFYKFLTARHRSKVTHLLNQRSRSLNGRLRATLDKIGVFGRWAFESFDAYNARVNAEASLRRQKARAAVVASKGISVFSSSAEFSKDPIVARLASFPPRIENLKKVVQSLLPQVDEIHVYLNEYKDTPEFLVHPKIKVFLGSVYSGDIKDNGKLYGLEKLQRRFVLLCDDDILYPEDYAEKLKQAVIRYGYQCVVGVHGTIYKDPASSYIKDRSVVDFREASGDVLVDQLGTGTVGFHTSMHPISWEEVKTTGVLDLWFARACSLRGLGLISVHRPKGWMKALPLVGPSIFAAVKKDDSKESALLGQELMPALRSGVRHNISEHLRERFTKAGYRRANLTGMVEIDGTTSKFTGPDRAIHFEVLITGWNCEEGVERCINSVVTQRPGPYRMNIRYFEDGSTDRTRSILGALEKDLNLLGRSSDQNMGPAFARDALIRDVTDPNAICVLVDMDDELRPDALYRLAKLYLENPTCKVTYGEWINQRGETNSEGSYTLEQIQRRSYRKMDKFLFTHLRTFKRRLYDAVTPNYLQDKSGTWLRYCTDVALMFPIVDQCDANEVFYIDEPLYLYNQYRPSGTQRRFGGDTKKNMFLYLRDEKLPLTTSVAVEAQQLAK